MVGDWDQQVPMRPRSKPTPANNGAKTETNFHEIGVEVIWLLNDFLNSIRLPWPLRLLSLVTISFANVQY